MPGSILTAVSLGIVGIGLLLAAAFGHWTHRSWAVPVGIAGVGALTLGVAIFGWFFVGI